MEDNIKNIDLLMDSMLKESMKLKVSDDFPDKLVRELEMRKKFQEQDSKTDIVAKRVTFAVIGMISAIAFIIVILFNSDPEKNSNNEILENTGLYSVMSDFSNAILNFLNSLIPSNMSVVIISGLLLLLVIIPLADRYLINRRSV